MADASTKTRSKTKTARPPLYKVMLLNDDFTPRIGWPRPRRPWRRS